MNDIELTTAKLPEPRWAVPGLIPEGVTIFAAPAKTGKSFLMLDLAASVAYGDPVLDTFPVEKGTVLYLALEDSFWRMQMRLQLLLAAREREPNGNLHIETNWPQADEGGDHYLDNWLSDFPETRLVVIDILRRYDPVRGWSYVDDSKKIQAIGDLAIKHRTAIVAVHHTNRRGRTDKDWLERIQGTMGVSGAAHAIMGLERERGQSTATLKVTGKDVSELSLPLRFDAERGRFVVRTEEEIEGEIMAQIEANMSDERRELLTAISNNPGRTAPEIALLLGRPYNNIRQLLWNMKEQNQIKNFSGKYYTPKQARDLKLDADPQLAFLQQPSAVLTLPHSSDSTLAK